VPRIASVKPLDDFEIAITFDDGTVRVISLRDRLFGPVFESLRDPSAFRQVFVADFGAVAWPNGADLAPDAICDRLLTSDKSEVTHILRRMGE
jgi:hypothetical protein